MRLYSACLSKNCSLGGVLAEVNDDLERAVRSLTVELADLKATLAEVRLAFATDRTQAIELPNPLRNVPVY
jgi:hypothetical protein